MKRFFHRLSLFFGLDAVSRQLNAAGTDNVAPSVKEHDSILRSRRDLAEGRFRIEDPTVPAYEGDSKHVGKSAHA